MLDLPATIPLRFSRRRLAQLCRRYHVRALRLFGSLLRPDFGPDSDVDVLVEFEEGFIPGLGFFALEAELTTLFGRAVDLNTADFLSPYFRRQVLTEAVPLYVGTGAHA